ncbi:hypothetical protein [Roseomonas indoligenes]|uniref:Uncharacterized protein n=1 Tax=Roseomonas indoligenes TaxID=2820811 RepID=A0A940S7T0_9PROT|nr:hypothetical protein [Pararoseomonas indoligenes]MBP0495235.1 hypothetical protein [Pararoseomonas indoligenes]
MTRSLHLLSLAAGLAASLSAVGAHADTAPRVDGTGARIAERSADEAIYDARYGTAPRNGAGQTSLEGSGATGGGGQHG